ncbi:PEP-CTERM sorting domain-containing protein [Sphingosinicella sp.]|uniref:PEP-CTERM sorting domain-containing protein n=1 Tax=Sphingosinicella sp. TaxID=1917971 RepID=UPI0035AF4317
MSVKQIVFGLSLACIAAQPAFSAIVTYEWTGGGTVDSSYVYKKFNYKTNNYDEYLETINVIGSGVFSIDTAFVPDNNLSPPDYYYTGKNWQAADFGVEEITYQGEHQTNGSSGSSIIFGPVGATVFFSTDVYNFEDVDVDFRQNAFDFLVTKGVFVVDGVVLPYSFDLTDAIFSYYYLKPTSVFDDIEGLYSLSSTEEWVANLRLTSLKVFVDGIEYTGPTIDTPEPAALTLLGLGIVGLGVMRRRRGA